MESGAREGEWCERGRVGRERVREWGERERKRIRAGERERERQARDNGARERKRVGREWVRGYQKEKG